jgi:hypothetical protein
VNREGQVKTRSVGHVGSGVVRGLVD